MINSLPRSFALCALLLGACSTLSPIPEKPKVEVAGLRIEHLRLTDPDLVVILRLTNPNRISLPVNALELTVDLNDRAFAEGHSLAPVTLPAQGSTLMEVAVHAHSDVLMRTAREMLGSPGGSLRYRVRGQAQVTSMNLAVSFDTPGSTDLTTLLRR